MPASKKDIDKSKLNKAAFLELLPKYNYNIGKACNQINVSRCTVATWKKRDEDFREKLDELIDNDLDNAEEKLRYLIGETPQENDDISLGIHSKDHKIRNTAAQALMFKLRFTHKGYRTNKHDVAPQQAPKNQFLILVGEERVQLNQFAQQMIGKMKELPDLVEDERPGGKTKG